MVKRLLKLINSVAVLDIDVSAVEELQNTYSETVLPIVADAQDLASIQKGIEKAIERFESIDIAIHNVGLCTFESEENTDYNTYEKVMDINFFGALRLAKTVLPYMRKARKERIMFTSSGVGVTGFANISPYAASEGAVESLAKCLKIENSEYGITFRWFPPPLMDTASAKGLPVQKEFKADAQKVGNGLAEHIWLKKFVICHSFVQSVQMKFSYRHPLYIGKLMTEMTKRAEKISSFSLTLMRLKLRKRLPLKSVAFSALSGTPYESRFV